MALTDAQIATFKVAITTETDPTLVSLRTAGATGAMTDWYNAPSTFIVWKTRLHEQEITSLTSDEGTVWSWPAFISRSVAEQTGWQRMFNGTYTINPSLAQARTGIADIFSGGTGAAQRTHILAMSKRPATRGEKVFATGAGTTATPGTLVFEGRIGEYDIVRALYQ